MRARWGAVVAAVLLVGACDKGDPAAGPPVGGPLPGRPAAGSPVDPGRPPHQVATGLPDGTDLPGGTGADAPAGTATVDLVSGATTVTVRTADLPGDARIRATTPDDAGVTPALRTAGATVSVHLLAAGNGSSAVTIELDRRVRWQVRLSGGATSRLLDLRGARLAGVDLVAGSTRSEMWLPAPDGAVPVRMAGGASVLTLHLPPGVAAGVRVGGGAGTVVVDGVRRTGLAGGTTVTASAAADRYEVDATAGVATLVLDRA